MVIKIRTPDSDSNGRFPNVVEMNRIFRKLIGGRGGHFALLFCILGATTPWENVNAAIDAVHRYGSYL